MRGVTWSSLSSMLALPLAIVVSTVLARTLGPEGFARLALLSFVVPLLFAVTDLGVSQAGTREASRAYAAGDLAEARALLAKTLGWNLLRFPVVCPLALLLVGGNGLASAAVAGYLVLALGSAGVNLSLNAENRVAALAKVAFVQALAAAAASISAALAGAAPETVFALALASGGVAAPLWLAASNPLLRRAALVPRLPRGLPAGFWRYGVTALAASVGTLLVFSRSEVVILDLLEEQQALAVFALAYGLAQRLTTPVDTLLGPLVPALSALDAAHPERLRAGFERALRLAAVAVGFLAATSVAGVAFLAPFLFGTGYGGVGTAFAVLAAISLLQSASQPYTALAYAVGRPQVALRALAVALVVDVGVAFALIPAIGLWGAVVANAAGAVTAIVLAARAVAGKGSVRLAGIAAPRLLFVSAAAAALGALAGLAALQLHPLAATAAAMVAGSGAFVVGARLAGGLLSRGDARVVADALPRPLARSLALLVRRAP